MWQAGTSHYERFEVSISNLLENTILFEFHVRIKNRLDFHLKLNNRNFNKTIIVVR